MEALSPKLTCPSCKGNNLVAGTFWEKTFRNFSPKGKLMMLGYSPLSFVCRDCGYPNRNDRDQYGHQQFERAPTHRDLPSIR